MIKNHKDPLSFQAWISLAAWMSVGMLLEALIAFRSPAYLQDPLRRELFRLAHTHGAVLNLVLVIASMYLSNRSLTLANPARIAFQAGVVLMPLGFLLGGLWHTETDPNMFVFLAPAGGILVIFAVVSIAFLRGESDS